MKLTDNYKMARPTKIVMSDGTEVLWKDLKKEIFGRHILLTYGENAIDVMRLPGDMLKPKVEQVPPKCFICMGSGNMMTSTGDPLKPLKAIPCPYCKGKKS